jgi:hypothetical protein
MINGIVLFVVISFFYSVDASKENDRAKRKQIESSANKTPR